jgi:hypothetical protein
MNRSEDQSNAGSNEWRTMVRGHALTLQIIVGALIAGVSLFTGYVIFTGKLQLPPQGEMLSLMAVGMAAVMVPLHFLVPAMVERAALANLGVNAGPQTLMGVFMTRTIIAAALLEGAALTSGFALLAEHRSWVLGVTATLLVLMAMQIPTVTRIEHWLELRMMERQSR